MPSSDCKRRDFLKTLIASAAFVGLDWDSLPFADASTLPENQYDAVIIGSGLGGLSCAAAFARQGFKPLVLEQHDRPGGYATSFQRPGGFEFDVSLHSTTVGDRNGVFNLIPGFPEITDVEFVPHPTLFRAIFPQHDFTVANRNINSFVDQLTKAFPAEKDSIKTLFDDMAGLANDFGKLFQARGNVDFSRFPIDFPHLYKYSGSTWAQIVDPIIKDPKLKGIISAQWGYYGLPPSKLASTYYAGPLYSYLTSGGFYPRGRSQTISNAFVKFIESRGGKVMLNSQVEKILVKDGKAYGVATADKTEYLGKVVVSNASGYSTFHTMLDPKQLPADYLTKLDSYSVSLSCFQVFLGLKKDLVREVGIKDAEIFYNTSYDPEADYKAALNCDTTNPGFGLSLYDNLFEGYSPKGKNTVNILTLQGYEHWKPFEADYWKGNKTAYNKEKYRIAEILIKQAEKVLPGLGKAIEVKEIGTPLTNIRYTGNYRGAIYGFDQTLDNSNPRRIGHTTPIKNLYLAGAWTKPGHGYGAVIPSGLECFGEIMKNWA
ncbi:MAG TPA: NAD(P)/FAD-dependent oxidoreductase [Terriglobales bacterium]|nr:NAD(P)/FAD-dependent oxidoreductase [Terriglobales bacterium]